MIPDLGETPAAGSRVPEGSLVISFGLGAGNTVRLSAGTSRGASDIASATVALPNSVSFTVPAVPVVWVSVWLTNSGDGSFHTYTWAYAVGTGTSSPATIQYQAEIGYLGEHWRRTKLAEFDQGIEVPDPGHGHDEISPVKYLGQAFDITKATHTAPFSQVEVQARATGTGYLRCLLKKRHDPKVVTPGRVPIYEYSNWLEVTILTPSGRGPALANLYAGAIAMLYRYVYLSPGQAGIHYIRNIEPPDEQPEFRGDDQTWRYDQMNIPLIRVGEAHPAGAR